MSTQQVSLTLAWLRLRYLKLSQSNGTCPRCHRTIQQDGITLQVDHIKPLGTHPGLAFDPSNLQVLCEDCNLGKSNRDATDFRSK